jgi:hypothetical protein
MDKLNLTGQNLGRVCNYKQRHGLVYDMTKWPNLKLKIRNKQLLSSLPLAFALPDFWMKNAYPSINSGTFGPKGGGGWKPTNLTSVFNIHVAVSVVP